MALSLTEQLDNLYTTTWQHMKDTVRDQIFDASPFWFWLKEKGKLKSVSGGRFLTEPLQFDTNDNLTWLTKGGTVPLNDYEFLTIAKYDWNYLAASLVRFGIDDQQNRGKSQIINLMNAKMENTQNSIINELETRLFAGESSSNQFDGLQHLVADDPTAAGNDVGEIDPSVYTWWRNQFDNMTGVSFATSGIARMRTMLNDASSNLRMDAPDIIVTDQTTYERYEDENLSYYRTYDRKLADMGFKNQEFKGIPMIWSPSCTQRMYFLNTNFISFQYDPMLYFDMTEWKSIPDQPNDRAAQIMLAAAFTVSRRRCQGVMFNMDTA